MTEDRSFNRVTVACLAVQVRMLGSQRLHERANGRDCVRFRLYPAASGPGCHDDPAPNALPHACRGRELTGLRIGGAIAGIQRP